MAGDTLAFTVIMDLTPESWHQKIEDFVLENEPSQFLSYSMVLRILLSGFIEILKSNIGYVSDLIPYSILE